MLNPKAVLLHFAVALGLVSAATLAWVYVTAPQPDRDLGDDALARDSYGQLGRRVNLLRINDDCWISTDDIRGSFPDDMWVSEMAVCFDDPSARDHGFKPVRVRWQGDRFLVVLPFGWIATPQPPAGTLRWAKARAILAKSEYDK